MRAIDLEIRILLKQRLVQLDYNELSWKISKTISACRCGKENIIYPIIILGAPCAESVGFSHTANLRGTGQELLSRTLLILQDEGRGPEGHSKRTLWSKVIVQSMMVLALILGTFLEQAGLKKILFLWPVCNNITETVLRVTVKTRSGLRWPEP